MSKSNCIVIRSRASIEQSEPSLQLPPEAIGMAISIECKVDCELPWHTKEKDDTDEET